MTQRMVPNLKEALAKPGARPNVVSDCEKLIESEVKNKSGLSGMAIKGAFAVVKAIKPGVIHESVDSLLDGFIERLEPFYASYLKQHEAAPKPPAFSASLQPQQGAVAEALLGFTDDKAKRAQNATMKKAYEKLRPSAKDHVQAAVPGLGQIIDKYIA